MTPEELAEKRRAWDNRPLHSDKTPPMRLTLASGEIADGVCIGWACLIPPERRLVEPEFVMIDIRCQKCQIRHEMLVRDQDLALHDPAEGCVNLRGDDARRHMGRLA